MKKVAKRVYRFTKKRFFKKQEYKKNVFVRAFWIMIVAGIVFGSVFQVGAQKGFSDTALSVDDPFAQTPTANAFLGITTATENEIINGCSVSTFSGIGIELIEVGNRALSGTSGRNIVCANEQAENGDTEALTNILNNSNSLGLNSALDRVTATVLDQRNVSGIDYFDRQIYALENVGQVSAQSDTEDISRYYRGTGYDLLRPIQEFWGWSVNVVYGILIFIIIVVAFAIIFRAQLSGGTVVTIQNSIPNIALAMILVPLSYAITGLFIDGITLGVNVVHEFFLGAQSPARGVYESATAEGALNGLFIPDSLKDNNRGLQADDVRVSWLYSGSQVVITEEIREGTRGVLTAFGITDGIGDLLQDAGNLIAPIINFLVAIILFITGFRIFWLLLKKFITGLLILPLFSPFAFATIALPGNGTKSVISYLKQMLSVTLAYVVAYAMILMSIIFSSAYFQNQIADTGNAVFIPPLLGLDLVTGLSGDEISASGSIVPLLFALISVGIYLMIPKVLKDIDAALGADGAIPFIGDVFQSAQDSINLGRAGLRAPGQAAGAIGKGAGAVANLPGTINTARAGLNQRARNAFDNLRGIKPGEYNSSVFRRAQEEKNKIGELERERRALIEKGGAANLAKAQIKQRQIAARKQVLAGYQQASGEDVKLDELQGSLSVEVSFNGQKGPIMITEGMFESLRRIDQGSTKLMKGKITLKAEGIDLNPYVLNRMGLYSVKIDGPSDLEDRISSDPEAIGRNPDVIRPGNVIVTPGNLNTSNAVKILNTSIRFKGPAAKYTSMKFEPPYASPDGSGKAWEIAFGIEISNASLFLNNIGPLAPLQTENKYMFAVVDRSGQVRSEIQSNPFDILVLTDQNY